MQNKYYMEKHTTILMYIRYTFTAKNMECKNRVTQIAYNYYYYCILAKIIRMPIVKTIKVIVMTNNLKH